MSEEQRSDWLVRGVSATTKRSVRLYAAEYDLGITAALEELVAFAFTSHEQQKQINTKE